MICCGKELIVLTGFEGLKGCPVCKRIVRGKEVEEKVSKVEITSSDVNPRNTEILIDGVKQNRVVSATLTMSVGNLNRLDISTYPEKTDIEVEAIVDKSHVNYLAPSDSIQGRIVELLIKQTEKGKAKYGHTLDDCPDDKFDWRLMAMEEMADCIQYQQKEIMRLEKDNKELKSEVEVLNRSHW